ncbi:MAG TPA: hypothetical protein VGO50_03470 [Pyrinomonadaceae bacterium]|jgi:hypothetical protein|nr:hypothetical protein [Pyrinomonadaceae bacterium]
MLLESYEIRFSQKDCKTIFFTAKAENFVSVIMDASEKEKKLPPEKTEKGEDRANWSHDIEERDYYYDDSTGYEVYDPEKEAAEEEGPEDAER